MLVEHGKAENELEELQLTKSDKSKQRPSRTKAPNQEIKWKEPAERIHVEESQSLDVVKSFAESILANFTVLTESMTNSFQKLGENLNVMNDNIIMRAGFLKIYQNSLTLTKLTKLQRSIRTMSKTLTSQLQAKQSHKAKGKKLMSQLLRTNFFLASRRRQIHRKLQAQR